MKRPTIARPKDGKGFVGAWGRFGWSLAWQDPPFWRWPRVEPHVYHDRVSDARGVLIGWRLTGLLLVWFDRRPVSHGVERDAK